MARSIHRASLLPALVGLCLCGIGSADTKDKEFKLSDDEKALVELTNKARAKEKLPALKPNEVLFKVARAHSANMAKQQMMEHVLDDQKPTDRLKAAGYRYLVTGENIAAGDGWSPEAVLQVWMDSEPHKKNILTKEFKEIGVGIARDAHNTLYFTQVFAAPRRRN